ncbi:arsenate reductase [Pedobacter nyackensis]|uniref:Arsenate reductase n=1 Tax=Pedobacter nyackensis TaxID=475255 RepID=A0A1W2B4H4_9SPHI|nr:arsenate reductase [Pedobacter nyackensis]SMC67893.1 arsenate reductase [Pedobacter nyackensis]
MIVYGIPNCNTVKKARVWLDENGFSPEFHDFKKKGITAEKLSEWCEVFGWEVVLNKKGTTWKKLSPEVQQNVIDQKTAVEVLLQNNSAIKRPVVEVDGRAVLISFSEEQYSAALK